MKIQLLLVALLPALLLLTTPVHAEQTVIFKPPQMGAPVTRVGGGTRGVSNHKAQLQVLAPEQTALTSQASPTLYWYVSETSPATVEITINQGEAEPLLEKNIGHVQKSGVQIISLKEFGITLQAGQEYNWTVALVNNPDQRSNDLVSSATLKYQPLVKPFTDASEMAEAGYWYDALEDLETKKSPQFSSLLQQVGINLSR